MSDGNDSSFSDRAVEAQREVFESGADTVEGTRTAMKQTFQIYRDKIRESGEVPLEKDEFPEGVVGPPRHCFALFQTLASRYWVMGISRGRIEEHEDLIWAELLPFLYLDHDDAIEALAEYVVRRESLEDFPWTADETRVDWLQEKLEEGVSRAEKVDPSGWASVFRETAENLDEGESIFVRWVKLLQGF